MNSIAAIDIGSTKAVTVMADIGTQGKARVVAVGEAPCRGLKRGAVVDIEETAQAVVNSVRTCEQMANRKINSVIVSVTGEHISGQNSQGIIPIVPPARTITREDVHRVINHSKQVVFDPDRELIHALPRKFKVDGQEGVTRPIGMSGERLEVGTHLVTGLVTHLQNLERCVNRAQIEVEQIVLQPLASSLAILTESDKEVGVSMIDIGGGTTDVAGYVDGSIAFTDMAPIGAQHITSDICKLLKTSSETAEQLKVELGKCLPDDIEKSEVLEVRQVGQSVSRPFPKKVLAEIIQSRTREILIMVKRMVESAGYLPQLASGFMLTGGGSKLTGIKKLAQREMGGLPVRLAEPLQLGGLGDMVSGPEYATVVGLIMYGLKTREEESVDAEDGDWRSIFKRVGSFFAPRSRVD